MHDPGFCYILYYMNITSKKRRRYLLALAIILAVIGLYLNRAYAHIYNTIGAANLPPVNRIGDQLVFNNMTATSSLVYLALGDSLMAGAGTSSAQDSLPYLLADRLAGRDKKVILQNYSVPGYKTADLINNLLSPAVQTKPQVITLLIGVNDIHNNVSADVFRHNYGEILERLTKETSAAVYAVNIPFIGADTMMLPPYQVYFDARTREFNAIIKELSVKYHIVYIDLYTPTVALFKQAGAHYSADLFHPSAAGYKIWAGIIYDHFYQ